jgi:hypothetical protein
MTGVDPNRTHWNGTKRANTKQSVRSLGGRINPELTLHVYVNVACNLAFNTLVTQWKCRLREFFYKPR